MILKLNHSQTTSSVKPTHAISKSSEYPLSTKEAINPFPLSSDGHYEEIPSALIGAADATRTVMENGGQSYSQEYINGVKDLLKDKESPGTVV